MKSLTLVFFCWRTARSFKQFCIVGFAPDLYYMTRGFAQFQMDKDGKLNLLRLSTQDGQAYEFRRE